MSGVARPASAGPGGSEPPASRRVVPAGVWQVSGPFLVYVAMLLLVSIGNPAYLGLKGLSIVTETAAPILLIALGQAIVLNIGSIDLSNAAIGSVGAILLAILLPKFGIGAFVVMLAAVTAIGAVNGLIVTAAQVPSFALTLGTLGVLQAAALVMSGSDTVYVTRHRAMVTVLYQVRPAGIPLTFWIGLAAAIALWVLLAFTRIGQGMTAMGKNEAAAMFSAIRTRRLRVAAFAISGFMGGLTGIGIVAQAGSASASGLGSDLLLPGIAAALVGGTAVSGGVTSPINVVFGALTVAFVPIAVQAVHIGAQAQSLVYGLLIIVIVTLTTHRSRTSIVK